jgi:hypothetical protein
MTGRSWLDGDALETGFGDLHQDQLSQPRTGQAGK